MPSPILIPVPSPVPTSSPTPESVPSPSPSPVPSPPQSPDPSPPPAPQFEFPDAPFQIGDRVESRCKRDSRNRKIRTAIYSSDKFLGVVSEVICIRKQTQRRPSVWAFNICFNEGFSEVVDYLTARTTVHNVVASDEPLPTPSPPPSPLPSSPPPSPPPSPITNATPSPATNATPTGQIPEPPSLQQPLPQPTVSPTLPNQHETWVPIRLCQILFLDEKHVKCKLGHANGNEWLMVVDPDDPTKILSLKDGGVRQKPQPLTKPKHPQEARALFGVMLGPDGKGRRMPLCDYTNKKVTHLIFLLIVSHLNVEYADNWSC